MATLMGRLTTLSIADKLRHEIELKYLKITLETLQFLR